MNNFTVVL
jgi:hypothetical protein